MGWYRLVRTSRDLPAAATGAKPEKIGTFRGPPSPAWILKGYIYLYLPVFGYMRMRLRFGIGRGKLQLCALAGNFSFLCTQVQRNCT